MPSHTASKRRKRRKIRRVLGEFKRGRLRSGSGGDVTNRSQAIAAALSEARRLARRRA